MRSNLRKACILLGAGLLTAFGSQRAAAEEHSFESYFGYLSVGTSYTINEGHIYWVGEFSGTATNNGTDPAFNNMALQCPSWFDVDFPNMRTNAGGYCVMTTTSGDALYMSWECGSTLDETAIGVGPVPFGNATCVGGGQVTGGSGELEGITGEFAMDGQIILFHPDGKSSGFSILDWTIETP